MSQLPFALQVGERASARPVRVHEKHFVRPTRQVLCNFGVLTTGFDAPNTDVVFITRPTASSVLYSQMLGRGLRGPAIGGTPTCKIIDVRDNIVGFGDQETVYGQFDELWS